MTVTVSARDNLMPQLMQLMKRMDASSRRSAMEAIGVGLVSMAKRSFNTNPALRPSVWAVKKDGTPSTLQDSTRLRNSITVRAVSENTVSIGSDASYARIHQLGGKTRPHVIRPVRVKALRIPGLGIFRMVRHPGSDIPARPYLPFDANGMPTVQADRLIRTILRARLGLTGEGDGTGRRG